MKVFLVNTRTKESTMAKYRMKPIVVDAIKWDGTYACSACLHQIADDEIINKYFVFVHPPIGSPILIIRTLTGDMKIQVGEYIIKGIQGEYYFCTADIFEAYYESTESTPFETQIGMDS